MERGSPKTAATPSLSSLSHRSAAVLDQAIAQSETSDNNALTAALEDERGRLRTWASNLGALQPVDSRKSLDHRLRDAPLMRKSVISGLERLQVSAERVLAIISGSTTNRLAAPISGSSFDGVSELDELVLSVNSAINHLFGLSMLIRRQRPRGRLGTLDNSTAESSPDISHVTDKFPKVKSTPWLARRLGNKITRQRKHIQYRQFHRQSLAKRDVAQTGHGDTATLADTVVATTFQEADYSGVAPQTQQDIVGSQLSVLTSTTSFLSLEDSESLGRCIPDLSDMTLDGVQLQYGEPFECPYCRTIRVVMNRYEWKRHVFTDLQPYVCTFKDCATSNQPFSTRAEWFQHESAVHRRQWVCNWCSTLDTIFCSERDLKGHLNNAHPGTVTEAQMPLVLAACARPTENFDITSCPLCTEWEPQSPDNNAKRFSRHLARHLQHLALEALPLAIDGLEVRDTDEISDEEGSVSGDSSNGEAVTGQLDDATPAITLDGSRQTPLTRAAGNGDVAVVTRLLEEGLHVDVRDTGGRTPLGRAAETGHDAVVQILLDNGADIEASDANGRTPLHWAVANKHEAVVRLLLDRGAYTGGVGFIKGRDERRLGPVMKLLHEQERKDRQAAEEAALKQVEEEKKKAAAAAEAEEAAKKAAEELKNKIEQETIAALEESRRLAEKAPIRFKDAVGRKFVFPFHDCATRQGMEDLIKQAFLQFDELSPHVIEGHYDLVSPDGDIILPSLWEKVIEPGWVITMKMWPMVKMPPLSQGSPLPPPGTLLGPPPGTPPPAAWNSRGTVPTPNVTTVGSPNEDERRTQKAANRRSGFARFIFGKERKPEKE